MRVLHAVHVSRILLSHDMRATAKKNHRRVIYCEMFVNKSEGGSEVAVSLLESNEIIIILL